MNDEEFKKNNDEPSQQDEAEEKMWYYHDFHAKVDYYTPEYINNNVSLNEKICFMLKESGDDFPAWLNDLDCDSIAYVGDNRQNKNNNMRMSYV